MSGIPVMTPSPPAHTRDLPDTMSLKPRLTPAPGKPQRTAGLFRSFRLGIKAPQTSQRSAGRGPQVCGASGLFSGGRSALPWELESSHG